MNALTDGELRAYVTDDKTDANIWRVQAGLIGDIQTISFESIVAPGHFLLFNNDGQVRVDSGYSNPFKIKATFRQIAGLANSGGFSLEPVGDPNYVLQYDLNSIFKSR